ncbi:peroxiredoxin family protein [Haloferula chungangensis]|uniref:Peroxiredoxin family protein n=1 Tax=Haloferula chungangensis TaxID=1048331 RepID=A0ABW2L2J1_9BACT
MRISPIISFLFVGFSLVASAGTPQQAAAVRAGYERSVEAWQLKMKLAKTEQERKELAQNGPDQAVAAKRLWEEIKNDLDKEWVLEPAAWFLRIANPLASIGDDGIRRPMMAEEINAVRDAVSRSHIMSAKLAPMCMALVACGDNQSMNLLRRIEKENPDKTVRGVAALGIAMLDKNLGDDARVMAERLTMLRKAIIDAADVVVDGSSVAEMAEDELYIIMKLSKGRVAPDLVGVGSGGQPMSLSDYSGKVVLLVFWNSGGEGPDAVIDMLRAVRADERFSGKPFEVVGVNSDPKDVLRKLEMRGSNPVDWPNFSDPGNKLGHEFRVGSWPLAYVLDGERKIHYFGALGPFAELTAAAVLEGE